MKLTTGLLAALAAVVSFVPLSLAQQSAPAKLTEAGSGITFDTWTVPDAPPIGDSEGPNTAGGLTFGMTLPPNSLNNDTDEFIGYLNCAIKNGTTGWCGISLGGAMTNSLLVVAWPYNNTILTSFRFATSYSMPQLYKGNATLTQISSNITANHFTLVFRCQNCLKWSHGGQVGSAATSAKQLVLGWVQAYPSPGNPQCPDMITLSQHNNGMNIWSATLSNNSVSSSYSSWAAKATKTVKGNCDGLASATVSAVPVPTATSYDYIIVGAGAGGIPLADKLSEAGKSVLLIEKGPVSSGRWGGTLKPKWLEGTNLTRFDVPGLCNQIWVDAGGIACTDTDQMAGCVLGGGTAVNAGLWWKPYSLDWDYLFPAGWKYADVADAVKRVFSRIPGTDAPSTDGKRYLQQGFEVLAAGLKNAGWKQVTANDSPDEKNRTFAHSPFMYSHGERGGPLATYLVTANARPNFKLWTKTIVKRVVRSGGHITGVELEAFQDGGYEGIVNITNISGRVVLSAGAFGSPKILFRSGIGPADQLAIVKNSSPDSDTMIGSDSWINLPVGYNLVDHVNTDTVITHPDVVFYDFYEAWTNVSASDKDAYLTNRTGILAQAAPNIGPIFWEQIKGSDGIVRQFQWQARVEGAAGTPSGQAMTISQYLGRGSTSRGRMTITPNLDTVVSTLPYLNDPHDKEAVIQGLINVQSALSKVANLTYTYPNATQSPKDFIDTMLVSYSNRRANHWMGTNKLGLDDGRVKNGTAVVDLDTKVYGTDNLFVMDAGIFPGMISTNPSAYFVVASEHTAERMLKLAAPVPAAKGAQCGGVAWTGSFQCAQGLSCKAKDPTTSTCQ